MSEPDDQRASPAADRAVEQKEDAAALQRVVAQAQKRFEPGPEARRRLDAAVVKLLAKAREVAKRRAAQGLSGFEPVLVGSAAKDTWLPGQVDLDVFLLFDPQVPKQTLEEEGLAAGHEILDGGALRYAEHPYVVGPFEGFEADVVPAYRVKDATGIQSSVDRTPFHNEWVLAQVRRDPSLTTHVRVMKAWMRGVDVYGAQTAQGGVSGYLVEVLTIHHGGFLPALRAFRVFSRGTRIDPTGVGTAGHRTQPLTVIDPVDPTRNAAAAVREDRLDRLVRAAAAFLRAPSMRFFEPAPLVPPRSGVARQALGLGGFAVVVFPAPGMREDARDPHLERAASILGGQLDRRGFDVVATWGGVMKDGRSALAVRTKRSRLPRSRIHMGPPVGIGSRSEEFRVKYEAHEDTMEPPFEMEWQGRRHLAVRLRERRRDLEDQVADVLEGVSLGKHADQAIGAGPTRVLPLEEALLDTGPAYVVAGLLVRRDPWEREGHPVRDFVAVETGPSS